MKRRKELPLVDPGLQRIRALCQVNIVQYNIIPSTDRKGKLHECKLFLRLVCDTLAVVGVSRVRL